MTFDTSPAVTYREWRDHSPPDCGKMAVIVARFNETITHGLLDGAVGVLRQAGMKSDDIHVFWVPGAFEIPTAAAVAARSGAYSAVLCLGAVIKGETSHDTHINRAVSLSLAKLGMEIGIPVLFGVLTCETLQQAIARSAPLPAVHGKDGTGPKTGNKGAECAEAALQMVAILRRMREVVSSGRQGDR